MCCGYKLHRSHTGLRKEIVYITVYQRELFKMWFKCIENFQAPLYSCVQKDACRILINSHTGLLKRNFIHCNLFIVIIGSAFLVAIFQCFSAVINFDILCDVYNICSGQTDSSIDTSLSKRIQNDVNESALTALRGFQLNQILIYYIVLVWCN